MTTNLDVQLLANKLSRAGLVLPDSAQAALDTLEALGNQAHGDPVQEALADPEALTVANVGKRTRDLALALTAQGRLNEASAVLERPLIDNFFGAINQHAVQLIEQAKPTFAAAAAVVQRAGDLLRPAATREDAWAAGPEAVAVLEQLPTAVGTLDQVRIARADLGRRAGGQPEREVCSFIAAADNTDRLVQAYMAFAHNQYGWHLLTSQEFVLQLNTPDEAVAVEHGAQRGDARAEQQAQEARKRANYDPINDRYFALALGKEASSH